MNFCMDIGETVVVSFSGGKTSAFMAVKLKEMYPHVHFVFIFANTGLECPETLFFIKRCSHDFMLHIVWVEAVINPEHGKGITHKVVCYETASRNGEPFEAHIAKSGIPNANKPQCSDRLKKLVIEDYKKKNGLKGVTHCIGMRGDEPNRVLSKDRQKRLLSMGLSQNQLYDFMCMNDKYKKILAPTLFKLPPNVIKESFLTGYNLWYPLFSWGIDKQDINDFWDEQPFTLDIDEHQGNCATCWKKSDKKLWLLAVEEPDKFEFMKRMESKYQHVKPNDNGVKRTFFRRNRSAEDILNEAKDYDAVTLRKMIGYKDDHDAGCSESCEAY